MAPVVDLVRPGCEDADALGNAIFACAWFDGCFPFVGPLALVLRFDLRRLLIVFFDCESALALQERAPQLFA
ncbi:MAG: hypothetical protein ACI82F_003814 [Planctomycetota bacterium]